MTTPPIDQQITFLHTRDLEKTADFYANILGLSLALNQGVCRIYQVSGGAFLGFCQHLDAVERPEGVILTLVSQDVDGWHAYLQAQDIPIEQTPALNAKFNIYHLFLRDPNGYLIEIQRFLDPRWMEELE